MFYSAAHSVIIHNVYPETEERASVHIRRIPIRRFCIRLLAATMLVCLPAVSEDAVRTTGDYETPGPVSAEDFVPKSVFALQRLAGHRVQRSRHRPIGTADTFVLRRL